MTIADANVWIALFKKDDSLHTRAKRLLTRLPKVGITEYVVVEVCSVLSMRTSKEVTDGFIHFIMGSKTVEILPSGEDLFFGTLRLFEEQKHGKLSFTDVSLLYLSREYTVLTFDKNLERAIRVGK